MKRTLSRVLALAAALPLAAGLTAGLTTGTALASHTVDLPGCYGAGTNQTVICNVKVTVGVPVGAETYQTTVPVCVGSCQQVPVTLVRTTAGEPATVCYSYNQLGGPTVGACYNVSDLGGQLIDYVLTAVQNLIEDLGPTLDYYVYRVCRIVNNAVDEYIDEIYC